MDENTFRLIETEGGESFHEARVDSLKVAIAGDKLSVYDTDADGNEVRIAHETVQSYGDPFYDDLEGFVRYCDGHCKVGLVETNVAGRILYIYDHRPESEVVEWPDGSEIPNEDRGYYTGGNFCYAFNIDDPYLSEWGYAHEFPQAGEDAAGMIKRQQNEWNATMQAWSELGGSPFIIDGGVRVERTVG